MTTMPECQCNLPEEMKTAGGAATLCHHSGPVRAREIQTQLVALLNDMEQVITVSEMFNTPLREVAEKYMREITGNDYNLRNEEENNIMMISFLRHMSIGMQAMLAGAILTMHEDGET